QQADLLIHERQRIHVIHAAARPAGAVRSRPMVEHRIEDDRIPRFGDNTVLMRPHVFLGWKSLALVRCRQYIRSSGLVSKWIEANQRTDRQRLRTNKVLVR